MKIPWINNVLLFVQHWSYRETIILKSFMMTSFESTYTHFLCEKADSLNHYTI